MDILRERNGEFDVIEYIKTPPSESELRGFLSLLENDPKERFHPGAFEKLGRNLNDFSTLDDVVGLLLEHPEAMNRPVCIRNGKAVIARPAELVEQILD